MSFVQVENLSWPRVKEYVEKGAIALLPIGSTEAHGPHLPLNVDVIISTEVCKRGSIALAKEGISCLTFPPVAYSLTDFAQPFSGTVSISEPAASLHLRDVFTGIFQSGFSHLIVVNHHLEPAHFRIVHKAQKSLADSIRDKCLVLDHRREPWGPRLGEEFMVGGSHAGNYETSLVLAAAPEKVNLEVMRTLPKLQVNLPEKISAGARNFLECGGENAYFGEPHRSSAAEGERLYLILVEHFITATRQLMGVNPN